MHFAFVVLSNLQRFVTISFYFLIHTHNVYFRQKSIVKSNKRRKKKGKNSNTPIAVNHWTILLHETLHNWYNYIQDLWTIVSAVGKPTCIRIPDIQTCYYPYDIQITCWITCYKKTMKSILNYTVTVYSPSVLWRCWLGGRKSIRLVKIEWWDVGVVVWDEV